MYSETVWHERIETIVCFIKASKKYFPIFGSEITRYANVLLPSELFPRLQ